MELHIESDWFHGARWELCPIYPQPIQAPWRAERQKSRLRGNFWGDTYLYIIQTIYYAGFVSSSFINSYTFHWSIFIEAGGSTLRMYQFHGSIIRRITNRVYLGTILWGPQCTRQVPITSIPCLPSSKKSSVWVFWYPMSPSSSCHTCSIAWGANSFCGITWSLGLWASFTLCASWCTDQILLANQSLVCLSRA